MILLLVLRDNTSTTYLSNPIVQVLNQDETPLLYSLVFGEGVVNDATSVVLFNAIQSFDLSHIDSSIALQFIGNFLYLFITSTMLGVFVSLSCTLPCVCMLVVTNNSLLIDNLNYVNGHLTIWLHFVVI